MIRTHTCAELNASFVNKEVVLCGWVHRRRDHGKLIFIDIRDRFGLTQVVFVPQENPKTYEMAAKLGNEFVISVKGKVNLRPKGAENPKLSTGEIEIVAQDLQILNPSQVPVFEIDETTEVSEELKLAYRYLDLRRQNVLKGLILRQQVFRICRSFLEGEDFIEVETPILTKSTPEGARDFLVPSRLCPGEFFALPQSPQLFKQVLMVAGIDRYFQIAKCFRDEDLRSDRQPEFTQLDLEMSFITEEDIFELMEGLFKEIFQQLKGIKLQTPFKRLTYKESMEKFNTDKPDLRKKPEDFEILWIVDFPLFKFNLEEDRFDSEHHPFTAPNEADLNLLDSKNLDKIRARSYDLVINGVELGSGSIRIHKKDIQQKIFEILGLEDEDIQERFGFLLRAFEFGAPPHGGFAFGLDRLIALLLGSNTIRDTIAFPKTQKGVCPLTQAPSSVTSEQLKELGITVVKKI
ncbi:MAG: aspartate--tRNA ligase [Candidatus Omnitrophota bacterium]|nr:aspartate--tRNA ligase [Candidatus Omnitrophota bacterium]